MTESRHYTCAELAALGLEGYPRTKRRWGDLVTREGWPYRETPSRGHLGFRREYLPPADVAQLIAMRQLQMQVAALPNPAVLPPAVLQAPPAPVVQRADLLTDTQRRERDARTGVLAALARLRVDTGCSQAAAIATLLNNARTGLCGPELQRMLQLARDKRGRAGDGYPSARTLMRWLAAGDLAPRMPQARQTVPAWGAAFLRCWQQPQKPSLAQAYQHLLLQLPADAEPPSIHQVRRFVGQLGAVTRERGRMGPRELKNIRPFTRRSFDQLQPNDVWTADGHTFDAEVQHPLHGRPFRPELTLIVDIATRMAVGWSAGLAESTWTVADALRHAATRFGAPAIFYVDNGSGFKNRTLADDDLGLLARLGCSIEHSLPYNSQARGVIERAHQTVWVSGSRTLASYMGAAMDREAKLEHFKHTRRTLKRGGSVPLMPWHLFLQWCEERVADYNARAHRTLGGVAPAVAWANHTARGWQPETIDADELNTLFRPRVARTVQRGEVSLFSNRYFSRELEEFHGSQLHVAYDIHDAAHIWLYLPDGRFVARADVDGNRAHYYPVPVIEQARQKRAQARLGRVEVKREEILAELHGAPALPMPEASAVVIGGRVLQPDAVIASRRAEPTLPLAERVDTPATVFQASVAVAPAPAPIPAPAVPRSMRSPAENYAEWCELDARIRGGDTVPDGDRLWHETYQCSAQYRAQAAKSRAS